ncbi:3-oxoacyl-ACP reductase [Corynebacterium phoceense]|uniref:3-oxoacyl-ACP reductase n=1 Tax=Corynebacterium phoceense TaxID=1686286 RepID=UPI00211BDFBF|nr:3-oxoacyl-ACP reductase [Corynebacterium phoceense]MCQ9333716.1 3-oxoacyl-ACP reductase [Corynebacterium phoceense]
MSVAEKLISSPVAAKAGVPQGYPLKRYEVGEPPLVGSVEWSPGAWSDDLRALLPSGTGETAGLVFDATGLDGPEDLRQLYDFFHPRLGGLAPNAKLVVLGAAPEKLEGTARIAARALEGFTRSLAKELRKGATCNLVYVDPAGGPGHAASTLAFLLSPRSAFVDGQVFRVGTADAPTWEAQRPLDGRLAVVTGAARGIGATIADVLARDGADVICVDVPGASETLTETANRVKGTALPLDVTAADAAFRLAEHARARYGRTLDVVVHNAGITRDKLLFNMEPGQWDAVLAVNLGAPVRITQELLESGELAEGASIIGVSSMAGISGNRGQTNYATTKAGIIGLVDTLHGPLAEHGSTINAVAPGFIETAMTAAMPLGPREIGRRINSLQQGGKPVDVAETVAYFAAAASRAVSGNVVRVCGQNMMGA